MSAAGGCDRSSATSLVAAASISTPIGHRRARDELSGENGGRAVVRGMRPRPECAMGTNGACDDSVLKWVCVRNSGAAFDV